jgi:hypothetical protein
MNNRGFLLGEETLKIVVAVISILFLVAFLGALYYGGFGDNDKKLAKASLEHLIKEIDAGVTEIEIYNPEGWKIMSKDDLICICKETILSCDPDETCKKSKEPIEISLFISIDEPLPITLELNKGVLSEK